VYILFSNLAQNAVHSAFSGYTGFTSSFINNQPVMIPVEYISSLGTRTINTETDWHYLHMLASTGQPSFLERSQYSSNYSTNNNASIDN